MPPAKTDQGFQSAAASDLWTTTALWTANLTTSHPESRAIACGEPDEE
jgi:hypothetical protein